jgi:hypothetical protein
MKLTNQQIATIDETLVLNGVTYDDIKLELVDHTTEIESETVSEVPLMLFLKEVLKNGNHN